MVALVVLACVTGWLACIMVNAYLIGRMKYGDGWSEQQEEAGAWAFGIVGAPLFLVIVLLVMAGRRVYHLGRKHG